MFGSAHTDSIVTENIGKARVFMRNVDSSSVMHNVPTCWAVDLNMVWGLKSVYQQINFMPEVPWG